MSHTRCATSASTASCGTIAGTSCVYVCVCVHVVNVRGLKTASCGTIAGSVCMCVSCVCGECEGVELLWLSAFGMMM